MMNTRKALFLAAGVAGATLLAANAPAQSVNFQWGNNNPQPNYQQNYQANENGQQGPFSDVRRLMGREVNSRFGHQLGNIKDVVFNAQAGEIIAVIGMDNGQNALVPMQALNVTGSWDNPQITCNFGRHDLENGPTVPNDRWVEVLNHHPHMAQRVYSHYNIPSPNGMGGTP